LLTQLAKVAYPDCGVVLILALRENIARKMLDLNRENGKEKLLVALEWKKKRDSLSTQVLIA
jgi:hypothetical protein